MAGRDVVVIGASAGGFAALREVVAGLPPDLPASVFVVIHSAPDAPGTLPALLSNAGSLKATHARHGERFRHSHIYIAPPDHHLLLSDGVMHVSHGPRENGFRP